MAQLDNEKPKAEEKKDEEKSIGSNNRYGVNVTRGFEDDFADFVGTKVSMARAVIKEGRVTDRTMKAFLDAFPKYNKK